MKSYTKTVYEGEYLGPIDWSYDFLSHFNNYCCNDGQKREMCEEAKRKLKLIEEAHAAGKEVMVVHYEVPHRLLHVGMYDGWPYWKPTPYVCVYGTLGPEWHPFHNIKSFKITP